MIGQTIGHFETLEKLGKGGMGVVWKARDERFNRFVALKLLPAEKVADSERKRRFIQEAKAASALNHPNIVTIYEIDQSVGVDFIATEFVACAKTPPDARNMSDVNVMPDQLKEESKSGRLSASMPATTVRFRKKLHWAMALSLAVAIAATAGTLWFLHTCLSTAPSSGMKLTRLTSDFKDEHYKERATILEKAIKRTRGIEAADDDLIEPYACGSRS